MSKSFRSFPTYAYLGYIITHIGIHIPPFYVSPKEKFVIKCSRLKNNDYTVLCQRENVAQEIAVTLPYMNDEKIKQKEWLYRMRLFHNALNEICGRTVDRVLIDPFDECGMNMEPGLMLPGIETI